MLIISKKKLLLTRFILWGGVALIAVGAVLFYISSDMFGTASIVLLGAGLVISLLGATLMKRLFRCPGCRQNVLPDSSGMEFHSKNFPTCCPNCGAKVKLGD